MATDNGTITINQATLNGLFEQEYRRESEKTRPFKRQPNAGYSAAGEPDTADDSLYSRNRNAGHDVLRKSSVSYMNAAPAMAASAASGEVHTSSLSPSLGFGDGGTGFFSTADNNTIEFKAAGGLRYSNDRDEEVRFRLPKLRMPSKVYLSGRLVTVGGHGSGAEVTYDSSAALIFQKSLLYLAVQDVVTMSVEYPDCVYHYHVRHNGGVIPTGRELKADLVSEVYQ